MAAERDGDVDAEPQLVGATRQRVPRGPGERVEPGERDRHPGEPLLQAIVTAHVRELVREDHLDLSAPLNNLGYVLMNLGKDAEAENCFRKSWAACVSAPAKEQNGHAHKNLGLLFQKQGKVAEAAVEFQAALAVLEPQLGAEHPVVKMVRAGTQG